MTTSLETSGRNHLLKNPEIWKQRERAKPSHPKILQLLEDKLSDSQLRSFEKFL
jgi:hypothetical protein